MHKSSRFRVQIEGKQFVDISMLRDLKSRYVIVTRVFADLYEGALAIVLASNTDPVVGSVETKWLPLQALHQRPLLRWEVDGVNFILCSVIEEITGSSAYVVLKLLMSRRNLGREEAGLNVADERMSRSRLREFTDHVDLRMTLSTVPPCAIHGAPLAPRYCPV